MKIQTMEKYISITDIPYTELLKRAVKGGLIVREYTKSIFIKDKWSQLIILYPYDMDNINEGMVAIEYNYGRY